MADVCLLLSTFFVVYSIVGVELLSEIMDNACWKVTNWEGPGQPYPAVPTWAPPKTEKEKFASCSGPLVSAYPQRNTPGAGAVCDPGFFCATFASQLYGYANFSEYRKSEGMSSRALCYAAELAPLSPIYRPAHRQLWGWNSQRSLSYHDRRVDGRFIVSKVVARSIFSPLFFFSPLSFLCPTPSPLSPH